MRVTRAIKNWRDRFIDEHVMTMSAFRKSLFRLRSDEKVFAHVAKDKNGLQFLFAPTDFTIGRALIESGEWQYAELEHYLEYVAGPARDAVAYFFDIGANIGTQTVYAARSGLFSKVAAIEAMPSNYELLCSNVILNGVGDTTECFNSALGARSERRTFIYNPLNPGGSRQDDGSVRSSEIALDIVPASRFINDLLEEWGDPEILVFWIDVEGMEEEIIGELRDVAARCETYFCVEYNGEIYGSSDDFNLQRYIESRKEAFTLDAAGMQKVQELSGVRSNQDIVFTANPAIAEPGE